MDTCTAEKLFTEKIDEFLYGYLDQDTISLEIPLTEDFSNGLIYEIFLFRSFWDHPPKGFVSITDITWCLKFDIFNWKYSWSFLDHIKVFLVFFDKELKRSNKEATFFINDWSHEGNYVLDDYLEILENGEERLELDLSRGTLELQNCLCENVVEELEEDDLLEEGFSEKQLENLLLERKFLIEAFKASLACLRSAHDSCLKSFSSISPKATLPNSNSLSCSKIHEKLDEFTKLISDPNKLEPEITKFLENNPEILQLGLSATDLNPQVLLEWQFPTEERNLKPDFMPTSRDGYADIVDFKLPKLRSKPIVGRSSRPNPSFEVDDALSQIYRYREWCSQVVNQRWLLETKKIKVKNPRVYLVIGHAEEFSPEKRQELRSIREGVIWTYDEIISRVEKILGILG
jgi:hypothetical protein